MPDQERVMRGEDIHEAPRPIGMDEQPCCDKQAAIPPRGEFLRNYDVSFQFLSVGCVVRVGCKSIPFISVDEAVKEFGEYVKDPWKAKQRWDEIFRKNE